MKMTWDYKFIGLCNHVAQWSKDRSTKVGAVIVNKRNKILSIGYNGMPIGVEDNIEERHQRPEKYNWFAHAEENAIASSAEMGISLKNAKLYCNYLPCCTCARMIIQSGIKEVVYEFSCVNSQVEPDNTAIKMLLEANVIIRKYL